MYYVYNCALKLPNYMGERVQHIDVSKYFLLKGIFKISKKDEFNTTYERHQHNSNFFLQISNIF
jgi:hypothetical protein